MKKQTKVLVAAALLTLGASFSSMAALKNGEWKLNEGGWQYYDAKEEEYVESEWCMSYGTEYWVDEDGYLGSSMWVTDGDDSYYAQSDGSMAKGVWKYILPNDEDAEEEAWFYFDAKGKAYKSVKKAINDYTYYFDAEGKMLTGWVDTANFVSLNGDNAVAVDKVVYCDENGALVKSAWIQQFPWTKVADDCYDDEIEWYRASSKGTLESNKKVTVGSYQYIMGTDGTMLTGWVAKDASDKYVEFNSGVKAEYKEVYNCDSTDGYIKKNTWKKLTEPVKDSENSYWYYFDKLGRAFLGTATGSDAIVANKVTFKDGEVKNVIATASNVLVNEKKIDGVTYYFNAKGEMISGLQYIGGKFMNLVDGAAMTGKTTLTDSNENSYEFYFAEKTEDGYDKYVAVDGNKKGYCYQNGKLMKAEEKGEYMWVETSNGWFIVDYRGKIQHSESEEYFKKGETYKFNDTDGIKENSWKANVNK